MMKGIQQLGGQKKTGHLERFQVAGLSDEFPRHRENSKEPTAFLIPNILGVSQYNGNDPLFFP